MKVLKTIHNPHLGVLWITLANNGSRAYVEKHSLDWIVYDDIKLFKHSRLFDSEKPLFSGEESTRKDFFRKFTYVGLPLDTKEILLGLLK